MSTEREPKILVYNEKRTWEGLLPITPELSELFEHGKKLKIFVIGTPLVDGQIRCDCVISDQGW